jgi:hypothetical protein
MENGFFVRSCLTYSFVCNFLYVQILSSMLAELNVNHVPAEVFDFYDNVRTPRWTGRLSDAFSSI